MAEIYILARIIPGWADDVVKAAKKVKGVKSAYLVFGRYDVVVVGASNTIQEAGRISGEVNKIRGIKSTETLLGA